MNTDIKIRVLLVDDESEMRRQVRHMFSAYEDFCITGEANSRESALVQLENNPGDVIFSDIQMEGGSGFELADAVYSRYPDILVVFLTGYVDLAVDV